MIMYAGEVDLALGQPFLVLLETGQKMERRMEGSLMLVLLRIGWGSFL